MGGRGKDMVSGGSSNSKESAMKASGLGEAYKAFAPDKPFEKPDKAHETVKEFRDMR